MICSLIRIRSLRASGADSLRAAGDRMELGDQ